MWSRCGMPRRRRAARHAGLSAAALMIPHRIVTVDDIPLTANGKLDEAALAAIDRRRGRSGGSEPETATESALAEVLSEILQRRPRVDAAADFLELGLDSIMALSVVQSARSPRNRVARQAGARMCQHSRAGRSHRSEAAMAATRDDEDSTGPMPLLPNGRWLYEYGEPRRLAQTEAIRLPESVTGEQLHAALASVVEGHEVLRSRLDRAAMTLFRCRPRTYSPTCSPRCRSADDLQATVARTRAQAVERLDPERGKLLTASGFGPRPGRASCCWPRTSWRWIRRRGEWCSANSTRPCRRWPPATTPAPIREHTSYRRWATALTERAESA